MVILQRPITFFFIFICFFKAYSHAGYSQCVVDICGGPQQFTPLREKVRTFTSPAHSPLGLPMLNFITKILQNKIQLYFDAIRANSDLAESLKTTLIQLKNNGIPTHLGPLPLEAALADIFRTLAHVKTNADKNLSVDRTFLTSLDEKSKERITYLADEIDAYYADPLTRVSKNSKLFFSKAYPNEKSRLDAARKLLLSFSTILQKRQGLGTKLLHTVVPTFDLNFFLTKIDGKRFSDEYLNYLLEERIQFAMAELAMRYQHRYKEEIKEALMVEASSLLKEKDLSVILERVGQVVFFGGGVDMAEAESLQVCAKELSKNATTFITSTQLNEMKSKVEIYRQEFINFVLSIPNISPLSKTIVLKKLESVEFQMPFQFEEWRALLFHSIDYLAMKKTFDSQHSFDDPFGANETALSILMLLHRFDQNQIVTNRAGNSGNELVELCKELALKPFSDSAFSNQGMIRLSYTFFQGSPVYQRGVIFHELGHIFESIFKATDLLPPQKISLARLDKQSFQHTQECLLSVQKNLFLDRERKFLSEDFADLISFLALPKESPNFMCDYFFYGESGYTDGHLRLKLMNLNQNDNHSSLLLRLLKGELLFRGTLPSSCSEAFLEEEGMKASFLWPVNFLCHF